MKEFFEGFKEVYCEIFSTIYTNRRCIGRFFAYMSMCIAVIILFASFCQFCEYLGKMEARKEYTAEIIYSSEVK